MVQRGHSGDGCDLASTLCRYDLRKGDLFVLSWARMKFPELLPFQISRAPPLEMRVRVYATCVRRSIIYRSEIRPLLADGALKFERAKMQTQRLVKN